MGQTSFRSVSLTVILSAAAIMWFELMVFLCLTLMLVIVDPPPFMNSMLSSPGPGLMWSIAFTAPNPAYPLPLILWYGSNM